MPRYIHTFNMPLTGTFSFLLGSSRVNGARVDRVLVASTKHMPDLDEDLAPWQWGDDPDNGLAWFWAYEEDTEIDGRSMPEWLLNLCIAARQQHGCNWVLLDPDGDEVPGLPLYQHL